MGFLSKLLNRLWGSKKAPEKAMEYEVQAKSLAEIWEIADETNLVVSLGMYIAQKCSYGECMSALSGPERILYITQGLEMEVNNGGFSQYFFNSSGDLANELVDAYLEIGATKTADICKRAVAIFGQAVPADRDERDDFISDNEEFDEILGQCDDAFLAYEEDLNALTYAYVMQHRDSFQ